MVYVFFKSLLRKKRMTDEQLVTSDLHRCLTTLDLVALGIGSTLGAGAYVVAGQVAKTEAGPAVVISFIIAAVASILAGLCYAEFGARVPRAGSAYVYTYVTMGELLAFIIGWNLILEYVIGGASVARTFSGYVDDLAGDVIIPWFNKYLPMHVPTLAPYFDPIAFAITAVVTVILLIGVKESAGFNNFFTLLNIVVLSFIVICGFFKDDFTNWTSNKMIPNATYYDCANKPTSSLDDGCCGRRDGCGAGGFAPYGFGGIIKGAATCFYAFVGFDAIATTGEETKNPEKSFPLAIVCSLLIVLFFYMGVSWTITLMSPYYLMDYHAPFSKVFKQAGWTYSGYVISVGAICALCTSLLGAVFPMPRVIYALGQDRLIFKCFGTVGKRFKTPILSTVVSGFFAAMMAALFDVNALVEMMSIGTLLAYTLVSTSVLILRYEYEDDKVDTPVKSSISDFKSFWKIMVQNYEKGSIATEDSSLIVKILTLIAAILLIGICSLLTWAHEKMFVDFEWELLIPFSFLLILIAAVTVLIVRQPTSPKKLSFAVPLVPYFPLLSMFFNTYLILNLEALTWVRFAVWMVLGFIIYFTYGIRNSAAVNPNGNRKINEELGIAPNENVIS